MTGITGYDAHAPPRPFPHPVGRLTRGVIDYDSGNPVRTWRMGRSDSRRPSDGGCSHHPGMMGAGDIRVSVEQTEARIIGHESHGHGFPAGNSQRAWNRIERCTGIEPA